MSILAKARNLAVYYLKIQHGEGARFWADKARALSSNDPNDTFLLAQALMQLREYKRACHILTTDKVASQTLPFRYLAAKCHVECQEWSEALDVLTDPSSSDFMYQTQTQQRAEAAISISADICNFPTEKLDCQILLLKGRANEELGNINDAVDCYKSCLMKDIFCTEALERLARNQYLTYNEEMALIESLPYVEQSSRDQISTLKYIYHSMMNDHRKSLPYVPPKKEYQLLQQSSEMQINRARTHLMGMDVLPCLDLTIAVLEADPYHLQAAEVHTQACLVAKRDTELYTIGQRLVNVFPELPLSWFAVACYYLLQANYSQTRKYLEKVLLLNRLYSPAWLAFGLSFSENGEYDQAIPAFSTAAQIMKGSYLPTLLLAKEYYHTGATAVASDLLKKALATHQTSPVVIQEVAVMFYDAGEYEKALKLLNQADANVKLIDQHVTVEAWEPLYNNLAHTYRKLGQLDEALQQHFRALVAKPNTASTHTNIAFVYVLKEEFEKAIEHCYIALKLNREDQMTLKILQMSLPEQTNKLAPAFCEQLLHEDFPNV